MKKRRIKDGIAKGIIYASSGFTVFILLFIIGFVLVKGLPGINLSFLTSSYENKTTYVDVTLPDRQQTSGDGYSDLLGASLGQNGEEQIIIESVASDSPLKQARDTTGAVYQVKKGDLITKIGKTDASNWEGADSQAAWAVDQISQSAGETLRLKVVRTGGGIVPMLVTTLYMIGLSLAIAAPVGICAAIYLNEYAKAGKFVSTIHFAIENLAGIPSIIYGLFGSLFFVQILKLQYSLLAGALTISILLLPTIITTTEEALKAIPNTYRESSLGLGATRLQTLYKIVLPNAVPGILVAVLLSIGRIVGESAALLLTAGTVAQIPGALYGNSASGATLTIKMYTLMKEENDLTTACAIGIVLLVVIIFLNFCSKQIAKRFTFKEGA